MEQKILWKILYREMDEKAAAKVLEDSLNRKINAVFSFTVVDNPFVGLECSEHTDYDAIFISSNEDADLNAWDFLRLLRNIGCQVPIVLLHDAGQQLPHSFILPSNDGNTSHLAFSAVLRQPYTVDELVNTIASLFNGDGHFPMNSTGSNLHSSSSGAVALLGPRANESSASSSSTSSSLPASLNQLSSYQSSSEPWTPSMRRLLEECQSPNSN